MAIVHIYKLTDPRNGAVRYVGKTKRQLRQRLQQHLTDKSRCRRTNWIKSLIGLGVQPEISLVENASELNWEDRERFWISHYRTIGFDLVNLTGGGGGLHNPSPETRIRMGDSHRGMRNGNYGKPMSTQQRKLLSEIRLAMNTAGWRHKPETLAKMGKMSGENHYMFGRHHSTETKQKLSNALSGEKHWNFGKHPSEQTRKNMSKAHIGQIISEEQKKKTSAEMKGVPKTETHKKNISNGLKGKPKSQTAIANSVAAKKANRERRMRMFS